MIALIIKRTTLLLVFPFWMVLMPVVSGVVEGAVTIPLAWHEWIGAWRAA